MAVVALTAVDEVTWPFEPVVVEVGEAWWPDELQATAATKHAAPSNARARGLARCIAGTLAGARFGCRGGEPGAELEG